MDMAEQQLSTSSIEATIKRNKEIIAATKQWTPELQMRIEQTYVLEIILQAVDFDK
jgi:hypothetical protein